MNTDRAASVWDSMTIEQRIEAVAEDMTLAEFWEWYVETRQIEELDRDMTVPEALGWMFGERYGRWLERKELELRNTQDDHDTAYDASKEA